MLREAGAAEVHIRISSPPVKWPCFFGIDFATRAELIANGMTVEEIGTSLGADSLAYISIDGMIEATTIAKPNLCRACFDGEYPMELPDPELLGKQLLETRAGRRRRRRRRPAADAHRAAREPPVASGPSALHAVTTRKFSPSCLQTTGASYAAAGVDIEAGDRAVELMKEWVKKAQRPEVLGGLGGFAGLFDASALKRYERPLLASATDGVGTKVDIARQHGRVRHASATTWSAMVMDDLVVCGAEPLFMTDYICVGKVHPERVAADRQGHRRGLRPGRLRPGRRRDRRAPGPARARTTSTSRAPARASSRPTGCWARIASVRVTR